MSSYPPESLNEEGIKRLALEMKTRRPTEMETEKVTLHFKSLRNFLFVFEVVGLLGERRATAESVAQMEMKAIITDMPLEVGQLTAFAVNFCPWQ